MRRSIGLVLVGLGVLMLVLAPLARWYAYPRLAVVSNDVAERVSVGSDVTVLDLGAVVRQEAQVERVTDVRSVRRIIPDQGDSTDDTAVWDTSVTTFDELGAGATPEENVLSYFEERVAFARHTGEAVDGFDQYYTPTGEQADRVEVDHTGFYFKLPFGTEQRSYPFWDSTIQDTRPMEFQNETTLEGLPVYVFQQVIEPTPVSALEIPGALFGQPGSIVADRVYSNTRTIWVEPHTGAIIKGQEEQDSYLDFEGTRGPTIVQGTLAYTDDQVSANVDEFASSADRLELVRDTLPVAAAAGGLVFVILGLLLARRGAYAGKRRAPVDEGSGGPGGNGGPGPGGFGGPGGGSVAAAVPGVVTRPPEERMPLQQRPLAQEPAGRSVFAESRYEPPAVSAYDAPRYEEPRYEEPRYEAAPYQYGRHQDRFDDGRFAEPSSSGYDDVAAEAATPYAEQPYGAPAEPSQAPAEYAGAEPADRPDQPGPVARTDQTPGEPTLDEPTPRPLPRRRPQSSAAGRPPVGRP
ncbi:DUF3068 domain-containing protein, partial [Jiangella rhizosphaerae]